MKASLSIDEYVEGILQKDISVLSRAITLVESVKPEHQQTANKILEKILPHTGRSVRVGITGVPGVGKSTFIEAYGQLLLKKNHQVAVLAVDPSSTLSKGSILGDKTRMETLSMQPDVFIRPSPSGGSLGGVERKTRESILLCEAAGFDYILIETVGVGQSETEVHHLSDFFLLLMLAGAGDELQGIKRGIMEMADGIAINKADGDNIVKAKNARSDYANAIHLFPPTESGWIPEVKICSGLTHTGTEEIFEMIDKYVRHSQSKNYFEKKRRQQNIFWFENLVQQKIKDRFFGDAQFLSRYNEAKQKIENNRLAILGAVDFIFESK
ncbi:MAG TPA: methylmalonyl Co-A mutase-associated GTPase MeaB [Bacteroidia bacterium]|jgi:LAO/AO transport system kinase|nr:methylmalonyl Co-A mutase-associated GTPase MeaB [Bacteroidia bacterium]